MRPERLPTGNLLSDLPDVANEERTQPLVAARTFRVERIVSLGQASPEGFWYDQPEDEWVCLESGRARLGLADPPREIDLARGDWLFLPAHCRHRVAWTDPDTPTVWLAVFGTAACDPVPPAPNR